MNDTENKLTPELVSMAISSGMLDASLDALAEIIRARKRTLETAKAGSMMPGDKFLVKDCSPKKWNNVEAEYQGREGIWLVCRISEADARRINRIGAHMPASIVEQFRRQLFRESHVGTFTHHHTWAQRTGDQS